MNDFFQSKFITDLKEGKLPEVTIVIHPQTLFQIGLTAFFVAVTVMLFGAIIGKLK